jgi:hypothetical protein
MFDFPMFDVFLKTDKRIQKQQRRITNRDAQPEDREAAARWLVEQGSGKALVALLSRFEMNLEHQINDKEEKEFVFALLASVGDPLFKPIRVHLKRCRQFALPIRLFQELKGLEATIEMVFELLQREFDKDDFKPDKKTNMLVWLTEHRHERAIEEVEKFLTDFDEVVRCSAVEVILAQEDAAGSLPLERALLRPDEDSNRLRVRLSEVFAQRRWPLNAPDEVAKALSDGFAVRDGRVVPA